MPSDLNLRKNIRGGQVKGVGVRLDFKGEEPHVQVSVAYCQHDIFNEVRQWGLMEDGER